MSDQGGKTTFFRQGSWLVIATVGAGAFMMLVHTVTAKMEPSEYGVFAALLSGFLILGIPANGLQSVFARQAAAALDETHARQLASTTRAVLLGTFGIWAIISGVISAASSHIISLLKIENPVALWMTLLVVLTYLWLPIFKGILQGQQNFLGLGWVAILDGVFRLSAAAGIVLFLAGQAAGAMTAVVIGQAISLSVGVWLCRKVLVAPGAPFEWRPWLARVIPLTLGMGVMSLLQTTDVLYVQSLFDEQLTPRYMAGYRIGFALVQFTVPLAAVMFPKIVRSVARTEKTDALQLTLISTAAMGILWALVSTAVPWLPLRIVFLRSPLMWESAPLVPWFCWAMVSYTLANVLVNNLLARERWSIVPWLLLVAGIYGLALAMLKDQMLRMPAFDAWKLLIQTIGAINLLLLLVSVWQTWGIRGATPSK